MLTKNSTLTAYYTMVCLTVAIAMVYTLYQSSLTVGYGQQIAELEHQKQELLEQQNKLDQQLAQLGSLELVRTDESLVAYQPIAQTITVTNLTAVASR